MLTRRGTLCPRALGIDSYAARVLALVGGWPSRASRSWRSRAFALRARDRRRLLASGNKVLFLSAQVCAC